LMGLKNKWIVKLLSDESKSKWIANQLSDESKKCIEWRELEVTVKVKMILALAGGIQLEEGENRC
jgi:hypothetical protein